MRRTAISTKTKTKGDGSGETKMNDSTYILLQDIAAKLVMNKESRIVIIANNKEVAIQHCLDVVQFSQAYLLDLFPMGITFDHTWYIRGCIGWLKAATIGDSIIADKVDRIVYDDQPPVDDNNNMILRFRHQWLTNLAEEKCAIIQMPNLMKTGKIVSSTVTDDD